MRKGVNDVIVSYYIASDAILFSRNSPDYASSTLPNREFLIISGPLEHWLVGQI